MRTPPRPKVALADMVEHTPRRADDDMHAGVQRGLLRSNRHAADEQQRLQRLARGDIADDARDLGRKLTGGHEHQRLHGA